MWVVIPPSGALYAEYIWTPHLYTKEHMAYAFVRASGVVCEAVVMRIRMHHSEWLIVLACILVSYVKGFTRAN